MTIRWLLGLLFTGAAAYGAAFSNGGFESGLEGWRFWTRQKEAGTLVLDEHLRHAGQAAGRVEHHAPEDWSLEPGPRLDVKPGDLIEMEIWVKAEGAGAVAFCASTWDPLGEAVEWSYASREAEISGSWQPLRTRVLVPDGVVQIQPRLIGSGKVTAWVDDFVLREAGRRVMRAPDLASILVVSNQALTVTLATSNATLRVHDQRSGRDWA